MGRRFLHVPPARLRKKASLPVFHWFPGQWQNHQLPELEKILFDFLPVCVHKAFFYRNLDASRLKEAIELAEDQEYIRQELAKRSWLLL